MKLMYTVEGECGKCHYLDLIGEDEKEFLRLRKNCDDILTKENVKALKEFLISKGMSPNINFWGDVEEIRKVREEFNKKIYG